MFLQGGAPQRYIEALRISLFLSASSADVRQAILAGHAAGQVLAGTMPVDTDSDELRLAFGFDRVIADDAAEAVFHAGQLDAFHRHEQQLIDVPHSPGPLAPFLKKLATIQAAERYLSANDPPFGGHCRPQPDRWGGHHGNRYPWHRSRQTSVPAAWR
ncbi:5'-nucleotidase [Cupriavidus sp. AcVe19-6a]|uniref:5'-nucleotidase n=1 Tax=Cupriavidus sp. AcVe19-6a TaxID=2821358 RepID=UPI00352E93F7